MKRCFSRYTQRLKTVFLAHARAEHDVARQLAEFLEFGCNLTCYVEDGLIGREQDLISMAEEGLSADVLVLLLSPTSSLQPAGYGNGGSRSFSIRRGAAV